MCAPGGDEGKKNCQVGIAGVRRCFGPGAVTGDGGAPTCIADAQACLFADECCGKKCLLQPDGSRKCTSVGVPEGGPCTASSDCVSGNCNALKLVCEPPVVGCKPLGATCATSAECCNRYCEPTSKTCTTFVP